MAAPATDHPTDAQIAQFKRGSLSRTDADVVRAHLAGCPACRGRSDSLDTTVAQADTDAPFSGASGTNVPGMRVAGGGEAEEAPPELLALSQYADLRVLGRGGMGAVYLAKNTGLDRDEVLKVVGRDMLASPRAVERFRREIQAAAKLNHPNVVTAYAILSAGDLLVFAMEYVPGEDLDQRVKRSGPQKVHEAAYYAYQVALGLQHAHEKGMVHRDIKPSNLILHKDGRRRTVKILDFGLAKAVQSRDEESSPGVGAGLTGDGKMLGTPWYMAPEQSSDAARVDTRADIYALGCTLHFLLTGKPPFTGADVLEVLMAHRKEPAPWLPDARPEVPAGLAEAVRRMLAKKPEDRFPTPAAAADALKPYVTAPAGGVAASQPAMPVVGRPADFEVVEEDEPPQPAARSNRSGPPVPAPPAGRSHRSGPPVPAPPPEPEEEEEEVEEEDDARPIRTGRRKPQRRQQKKLPIVPLVAGGVGLAAVIGVVVALSGKSSDNSSSPSGTGGGSAVVAPAVVDKSFADDKRKLTELTDEGQLAAFVKANGPARQAVWQTAAAGGDPAGMVLLAAYHQAKAADARGKDSNAAARNDALAVDWFRRAAARKHPGGMNGLGLHYLNGWGLEKDAEKAVQHFREAAEQRHPDGLYHLGRCYALELVPGAAGDQSKEMAASWYEKAAQLDHPAGMNAAGHAYCYGNGVTKDYATALSWFRKAEAKGDHTAMYNLGVCYLEGYGVPADREEAVRWLKKAAAAGSTLAKTKLSELGVKD